MGALYIIGAAIYALRVPERFFPGKCDIWVSFPPPFDFFRVILFCLADDGYIKRVSLYVIQFQSHQIFHIFVIIAAFVHYHGITEMAMHRMSVGECPANNDIAF
jgi:adiponectin receptor